MIGIKGEMGAESLKCMANLTEMLSKKQNNEYSEVMGWLRTKFNFEVLMASLLCVRGSKRPWYKQEGVRVSADFDLLVNKADLYCGRGQGNF